MKKIKGFLLALLAAVLALTIPIAACNSCSVEEKTLESISLDTSNTTQLFSQGEDFTAEGLVIVASFNMSGETISENINYNAEGVIISSSSFDKNTIGDYTITVSYTYLDVTKISDYEVSVMSLRKGLSVTYKSGIETSVNLSSSKKTADLSDAASWIEVRQPNKVGVVDFTAAPLSASDYSVKVYKDKEEVTNLTNLGRGAYQIWASKEEDGTTFEGFALYYVVDEVDKIEFKSGKLLQQRSLKETMSSTWVFTVTYKSGDFIDVGSDNRYLVIPKINANATENSGSVNVSFNEPLPNGASQTKSVSVTYTLEGEKAIPDMAILSANNIDAVDKQFPTQFATFEVLSGQINNDKDASITLPTGIEVNGSQYVDVGKAYRSGGATTTENPRKITFSTDRNFEIYVYGRSTSSGDLTRKILIEATGANSDYIDYNPIDGYKTMLDDGVDGSGSPTPRAQEIRNINALTDFEITFTGNIDLFYVLIVFEAV